MSGGSWSRGQIRWLMVSGVGSAGSWSRGIRSGGSWWGGRSGQVVYGLEVGEEVRGLGRIRSGGSWSMGVGGGLSDGRGLRAGAVSRWTTPYTPPKKPE